MQCKYPLVVSPVFVYPLLSFLSFKWGENSGKLAVCGDRDGTKPYSNAIRGNRHFVPTAHCPVRDKMSVEKYE